MENIIYFITLITFISIIHFLIQFIEISLIKAENFKEKLKIHKQIKEIRAKENIKYAYKNYRYKLLGIIHLIIISIFIIYSIKLKLLKLLLFSIPLIFPLYVHLKNLKITDENLIQESLRKEAYSNILAFILIVLLALII